ncbi:MAG: bifunctional adenosylcobinamide kinase/adenosylcobinamide-phosphate guanylyltransferase, partial [Dehalococcoidia bacterium]
EDPAAAALGQAEELLRVYQQGEASWVVVSNEVGLGVVPPTESGRLFRDTLGRVNQLVARRADRVYVMVAGLGLELKALGASPLAPPDTDASS